MALMVQAKAQGFYGGALREPGSVFEITSEAELGRWMERLDGTAAAPSSAPATTEKSSKKRKAQQEPASTTDRDVI